jgi:transcriptional regulator with XRE-family HTH domain
MFGDVATNTPKTAKKPTKKQPSELGRRLRALRKAVVPKLTQDKLAEMAGLARITVAYLETGQSQTADTDTVVKLAAALQVRLEDLTGTGSSAPITNAVAAFSKSSWGDITKPTKGELDWLLSLAGTQLLGGEPTPEVLHHLIKARRAAIQAAH